MKQGSDSEWTHATVIRSCPLCGGLRRTTLSRRMQHHLDLTTVVCNSCSFVYTNPMPTPEVYGRFYLEAYAHFYRQLAAAPPRGDNIPESSYAKTIFENIEKVRPLDGARLLEVGPGNGNFLWWAMKRGLTVLGVEPSTESCATLSEAGLPMRSGTLESLQDIPPASYDILAMFHVLEHFYDPNTALERCWELLAPGGIIVIAVPNILKPYRSLDRYFLRYVHPSSFSPATLNMILERNKFDVVLCETGGSDWRVPQSLFYIARRAESGVIAQVLPNPADTKRVLLACNRYRREWMLYGAARYFLRERFWAAVRFSLRILRPVKRRLISWVKFARGIAAPRVRQAID